MQRWGRIICFLSVCHLVSWPLFCFLVIVSPLNRVSWNCWISFRYFFSFLLGGFIIFGDNMINHVHLWLILEMSICVQMMEEIDTWITYNIFGLSSLLKIIPYIKERSKRKADFLHRQKKLLHYKVLIQSFSLSCR